MQNLYNVNGLMFWSQEEILLRDSIKNLIVSELTTTLKSADVLDEYQNKYEY